MADPGGAAGEKQPRALVLGSVHMDLIAEAARLPGRGQSVGDGVFSMSPGGKAGNQAAQLALCGIATTIATRLGEDHFGRTLADALRGKGVDIAGIVWDGELPTGASTVMSDGGDYASIIAPGAAGAISEADLTALVPLIAQSDALVLQMELSAPISLKAAHRAKEAGVAVVLNPSPVPAVLGADARDLMAVADLLILNHAEAISLFETAEPDAVAAATGAGCVVVTSGSAGARAIENGVEATHAAYPAEIVDTVGAGDAFLGAFTASWLSGAPLERSLTHGAAAGAIAVSRRGALPSLPTCQEILSLIGDR